MQELTGNSVIARRFVHQLDLCLRQLGSRKKGISIAFLGIVGFVSIGKRPVQTGTSGRTRPAFSTGTMRQQLRT